MSYDGFFAEYNYEEDIRTQREEAKEEGRSEGRALGLSEGLNKGRIEGIVIGRTEGEQKRNLEVAMNFIRAGADFGMISQCTGLTMQELQEIKDSLGENPGF